MLNFQYNLPRHLNRYFGWYVYGFSCFCSFWLLWLARENSLLGTPQPGTDQLTMLQTALGLTHGRLPDPGYMYSPVYTLFLALLSGVSGENLTMMRALQAAFAALAPVLVYRIGRRLRFGFAGAQLGALLYCFYGPALLIGLEFLRAAPLGVVFLTQLWLLLRGGSRRRRAAWFWAGMAAGIGILGRETFVAVALAPLLLLLFRPYRWAGWRGRTGRYLAGMALAVIPVLGFNWMTCGVPAVVPGHTANVLGAYHGEAVKEGVAATAWAMMTNLPGQVRCFFSNYEIPNSLSFYAHGEILGFLRVFAVPANVLLLLALLGGVGFFRRRGVQLTVLLIAAYVGSMLFFTFFYRFRVPVMGPVCVLAGGGLVFLGHLWRGKKWWQLGAAGLFLVLGMILTWQSPHVMRPAGERRSVVALLILLDRLEEAETLLDGLQQDRIGCTDLAARLYGRLRETGAMEAADRIGRRYGRRVEP